MQQQLIASEAIARRSKGRLWERPAVVPAYALQARDLAILRAVYRHRYLQPRHVVALFGGSPKNLRRRLQLLWADGYLERPKAQRPLRLLEDELIYALGSKGARWLAHEDPSLSRIAGLDWSEGERKIRKWGFLDHELEVSDFMVSVETACQKIPEIGFRWDGYPNLRRHFTRVGKNPLTPDAVFELTIGAERPLHFVEIDRGTIKLERMETRYGDYYRHWRQVYRPRGAYFRVLTISKSRTRLEALRRAARRGVAIARGEKVPKRGEPRAGLGVSRSLWFTTADRYDLANPVALLGPVFEYPDGRERISLVEPFVSLTQ